MSTKAIASGILVLSTQASFAEGFAPTTPVRPRVRNAASSSLSAIKEATFGMGCFWKPAESLLKEPGVLATTVGYTGAPPDKQAPTYDSVCFGRDWVEAVRVAYDDEVLTYEQLLDYFFQYQNPKPGYRQYDSIIFANDGNEEKVANKWKADSASSAKQKRELPYDIVEIEPVSKFYKAEEYHQRYWEKQRLKFFIGFLLIAGESGAYNNLFDGVLGKLEVNGLSFDGICGAVFLLGAAWTLLERLVTNGNVKELNEGDLVGMAKLERN